MEIVKEFSRFADEYRKHNIIQSKVASYLTSLITIDKYKNILDLGSGSGAVYQNIVEKNIEFEKFIAFDFSSKMLKLHPNSSNIQKICADFNQKESFEYYKKKEFDILISSSALQWSSDLSAVLETISLLANKYYFAFFTSNTFKTLHQTAGIDSPIYSKEDIIKILKKNYDFNVEEAQYHLNFSSVQEMFRYIKRSGVSGGIRQLSYKEMKDLIKNYPLNYLEFEVIFVKAVKS